MRVRYTRRGIALFVFFGLVLCRVAAVGNLEIGNQTREITYNPDVGLQVSGAIEVRHRGDATDFFVTIGPGRSGTFASRLLSTGTDDLTYQIYDDSVARNVIKDLTATPGSGEVLWGFANQNDGLFPRIVTVAYFLEIPAGQLLASGTYTDSVTISVYSGTLASPVLEDSATLTVTGPVANNINLSLVDAGGDPPLFGNAPTDRIMDFGELVPGAQGAMDLLVEANCAFTIALQSTNDGFLAHTDPADTSLIPYQLEFNTTPVDFSPGGSIIVGTSPGYRYPIVVTIGDLGLATSGTYEDVITITVTAQ